MKPINITTAEQVGDYDLCFPIADLYHNHLLHNVALEKAA